MPASSRRTMMRSPRTSGSSSITSTGSGLLAVAARVSLGAAFALRSWLSAMRHSPVNCGSGRLLTAVAVVDWAVASHAPHAQKQIICRRDGEWRALPAGPSRLAVTRGAGGAWPTMIESASSRCAMEGDIHMQPPRAPTSGQEEAPVEIQPPRVVFVHAGTHAPTTDAPALPGSKYYTLRYLLNALLAAGESVVRFPARSEDTAVLVAALRALGARVRWEREEADWRLRVAGTGGRLQAPPDGVLRMGNAGAVLRLLLGVGALLPELRFTTDHPDSLGRRPNADLLAALESLGIQVDAQGAAGCLPITLRGGPPRGGGVSISGARSSQYLSALLYLAPQLPAGLAITVPDVVRSAPLVRATLRALALAGIDVEAAPDLRWFRVAGGQTFAPRDYLVPGDGPSAAALVAAALALDVPLRLHRLPGEEGDVRAVLAALGARSGAPAVGGHPPSGAGALGLGGGVGAIGGGG